MKTLLLTFLLLGISNLLVGQTQDTIVNIMDEDEFEESILEQQLENLEENAEDSGILEDFEYLQENPININTASYQELSRLPGIDDFIINGIILYRTQNKKFQYLDDLLNVPEISQDYYRQIIPFVTLQSKLKESIRRPIDSMPEEISPTIPTMWQQVSVRQRASMDVQDRRAFKVGKYQGNKIKVYERIKADVTDHIVFGFIHEKDAGEINYFDYLNGYVQFKNWSPEFLDENIMFSAIAGAYQAGYGQGLLMWNAFGFGKSSEVINSVKRRGIGIRPYLSSDENKYLWGGGVSVRNLSTETKIELFASHNKMDGRQNLRENTFADIDEQAYYYEFSFDFSGFHRDSSEDSKRGKLPLNILGFNIQQEIIGWGNIGGSIVRYGYDRQKIEVITPSISEVNIQNRFIINKNEYIGYSGYWNLTWNYFNSFGELAYFNESIAFNSGVIFKPSRQFSYIVHLRKYDPGFMPLFGNSFSERSSSAGNERGIYQGIEFFTGKWKWQAYIDWYEFPWATFGQPFPRKGKDYLISTGYALNRFHKLNVRFKHEIVEESFSSVGDLNRATRKTGEGITQRFRIEIQSILSKEIDIKTKLDVSQYEHTNKIKSNGYAITEIIRYRPNLSWKINSQISYFDAPVFDSRLYAFEYGLPGLLTSTLLYGQGIRYAIASEWNFWDKQWVSFKLGHTIYSDRNKISSGDGEIEGNQLLQIGIQFDWRF